MLDCHFKENKFCLTNKFFLDTQHPLIPWNLPLALPSFLTPWPPARFAMILKITSGAGIKKMWTISASAFSTFIHPVHHVDNLGADKRSPAAAPHQLTNDKEWVNKRHSCFSKALHHSSYCVLILDENKTNSKTTSSGETGEKLTLNYVL